MQIDDFTLKFKHEIEEVSFRALKTLYMKTFKTFKIEKSSIGNNFDLLHALLDLAPRLKEREQVEMVVELLTASILATESTQRAKMSILMSNGISVLAAVGKRVAELRLGPVPALKELQDLLMASSVPSIPETHSGRAPITAKECYSDPKMTPIQNVTTFPSNTPNNGAHSALFPIISSNNMRVFAPTSISDQDDERIVSFSNLLSGIPLEEKIEIDLFHVICSRIGPQLFLQRSILLKKVLFGLESPNPLRLERSLYYISFLLTDWFQLVLKSGQDCTSLNSADSPSMSPLEHPKRYHTFSSETFMSSFQTDYLPSHITSSSEEDNENQALRKDDFVDVGYACNIIFQCIVPRLRQDTESCQIVKKLFPFLKMYLESCQISTKKDMDALCRYITSYFSGILDQVHRSLSSYYVEGVELQIMCLGFSLLEYLAKLLPEPSFISPFVVEYLIQKSPVCVEFICRRILESGDTHALSAISKIFQLASSSVKVAVGSILNEILPGTTPKSLIDILPALYACRSFSQSKAKENEFCIALLSCLEASSLEAVDIEPHLAVFQSFYSLDNGKILTKLFHKCQAHLHPQNVISFWFRALFSRDEGYRNEAGARLESLIGVSAKILSNLFVFPSSILSQMSQNQPSFQNGVPTLSIETSVKLIQDIKMANAPKLKEAFSVIRFSLQDVRTRSSLIQFGITNMLLKFLNGALHEDGSAFVFSDLIGCLKIIAQCDPKSRSTVGGHHQLLVKLLTDCESSSPWEEQSTNEHQLNLPICIVDSFYLYGLAANRGTQSFSGSFSDLVWKSLSKVCQSNYHERILSDSLKEFGMSGSHSDCMISLSLLHGLALNTEFGSYFAGHRSLQDIFGKFLNLPPASEDDGSVLLSILDFMSLLPVSHPGVEAMLDQSWPLLLKLSSTSSFEWMSVDTSLQFGEALCSWICRSTPTQITKLSHESQFIESCVRHLADEHIRPITYLSILLPFCNPNCFLGFLNNSLLSTVLVGYLIELIINRVRSNSYQNRKEAYLATLLLRNITSLLIKSKINFWHEYRVNGGNLNWLQLLLNHEDDDFQLAAIGITANLILSDDAFVELCDSIPYFVDSSVAIVVNTREVPEKRKEALLLIGNFFLSLKLRSDNAPHSDDIDSQWKRNGFHIMEPIFPLFPSLLDSEYPPLRLAALLLLHNMCCANKYLIRKLVHEYSISPYLFAFVSEKRSLDEASNGFLVTKSALEMSSSHSYCSHEGVELVLRIISMLVEGSRDQLMLLLETGSSQFQYFLQNLVCFEFSASDYDAKLSVCSLFSNVLQLLEVHERKLLDGFVDLKILTRCFALVVECLESPSFPQRSLAYSQASQILSWQFSCGREAAVEAALQDDLIGHKLTKLLLFRFLEESEALEIAAAQICLEFLVGTFNFAKEIAISTKFFLKAEKELILQFSSGPPPSPPAILKAKSLISLISKLSANHSTAKVTCCTFHYLRVLGELVTGTAGELIQETAAESLINLTRNCHANAVKVCSNFSTKLQSLSLLELVLSQICHPVDSVKSFRNISKVIICLFSHKETRSMAIKKGYVTLLSSRFNETVRQKKPGMILGFLAIFQSFVIGREEQLCLLTTSDFGHNLLDLISNKHDEISLQSLNLMRIIIQQRENKAYFLANENRFNKLVQILNSSSIHKLSLITSIIWIFVYDFEKAKVAFKRHLVDQLLLETHIRIEGQKGEKCTESVLIKRNINSALSILS